jgi:hypothetical protein
LSDDEDDDDTGCARPRGLVALVRPDLNTARRWLLEIILPLNVVESRPDPRGQSAGSQDIAGGNPQEGVGQSLGGNMLIWYYGSYLGLPQEARLASGNAVYRFEEVSQSEVVIC